MTWPNSSSVVGVIHALPGAFASTGVGAVRAPGGNATTGRGDGDWVASASSSRHFIRRRSSSAVQSRAKVFIPVRIGRYPVQRQRLPSKRSSICRFVGVGLAWRKADMAMTKPVVQYPHWVPLFIARRNATGFTPSGCACAARSVSPGGLAAAARACSRAAAPACAAVATPGGTCVGGAAAREKDGWCARRAGAGRLAPPVPSTVVTARPSRAQTGRRHELIARCSARAVAWSQRDRITVHAPHPP